MKRFLIEIDDDAWETICAEMRREYQPLPVPPPVDEDVLYDYLCMKTGAGDEWPHEFHGVTITEISAITRNAARLPLKSSKALPAGGEQLRDPATHYKE